CQLLVMISVRFGIARHIGMLLYRGYHHLREWGMLEVYLMGILVSIVKLIDMADLSLGIGLNVWLFTFLVFVVGIAQG
ncbi:paraquat-inducible protein A, partial [Morganella morganii]